MKYTIHGLQQEKLLELGLDNDDALILAVIKEMYASKKMEYQIIDGERFIWIDQGHLLKQIPIIGAKSSLKRRFKKFDEMKIIERRVLFVKNGVKGKFSYINITPKLDELSEYAPWVKMSQPLGQNEPTLGSKWTNKDTPISDTNNNISKDILCSTYVQRLISKWNSIGLSSNLKTINAGTNRYKMLKARIKQFSEDEILNAIDEIIKSDFLLGKTTDFEITFDWFIKPNNFQKVLEGNYTNKERSNSNGNNFERNKQCYSKCEKKNSGRKTLKFN